MASQNSAQSLRFRRSDAEPIAYQVRRGVATRQELLDLWKVVKAADARLQEETPRFEAPKSARQRAQLAWGGGSAV